MALVSVTEQPWRQSLQYPVYGSEETYLRAAAWLKDCATVADWGGSTGFFGTCLPPSVTYTVVDGTQQYEGQVLANLEEYREPSEGILLRHVLECAGDWVAVLRNALASFTERMVVVTFTPLSEQTRIVKYKSGWPVRHFDPNELRELMGALLVRDEPVQTTHPERVYYLSHVR